MNHFDISERGARQRAQRRGLSLRKIRSGRVAHETAYWLVVPGANNVVAGGDAGMTLAMVAAWLSGSSTTI